MIEKRLSFTQGETKVIERLMEDDAVAINHMVLGQGDALPEHFANSNVYMLVVRGTVTLRLDEQPAHDYPAGSLMLIPFKTRMNVGNQGGETLELFVVKAPGPRVMGK